MINFHKPACSADVVGLDGYCINHNDITSFIVDGNKYLDMGIISGSYVICDKNREFIEGDLSAAINVETNKIELIYHMTPNMTYLGRVIMAVKSFTM